MPAMYVTRYGYPRRQTLALTKLTRLPKRPAAWRSDGGDDLVYVSTASQTPAEITGQLASQFPQAVRQVMETCAARMVEHYARGGSLPTQYDVRLFVQQVERATGAR